MATETNINNKNVTVSQLKKSLERSKTASDKAISTAISGIGGGEIATDAEIDAMLDEVFGASSTPDEGTGSDTTEGNNDGTEGV